MNGLADAQKRAALGRTLQGRGARGRKRSMPFREALIELQSRMEGKGSWVVGQFDCGRK